MGLFKSLGFGKKEGGSAEGPKAEAKDSKSAADVGRERVEAMKAGALERVDAIKSGASSLWESFKGKASSMKETFKTKAMEAYSAALGGLVKGKEMAVEGAFAVVGGIEKGAKATVEGGKAAVEYAKETGREGMEIGQLAVEAGKDAKTRTKETLIDFGYTGAALAIMSGERGVAIARIMKKRGVELKSAAGKMIVEKLARMGDSFDAFVDMLDAQEQKGKEDVEKMIETVLQIGPKIKEAGIDLRKRGGEFALSSLVAAVEAGITVAEAIEGAAGRTLEKGREIVGVAKEKMDALRGRAREAKDGFFGRLTAARDRFSTRLKQAVIESLRPEIDNLIKQKAEELLRDREALSADVQYDDEGAEEGEVVESAR